MIRRSPDARPARGRSRTGRRDLVLMALSAALSGCGDSPGAQMAAEAVGTTLLLPAAIALTPVLIAQAAVAQVDNGLSRAGQVSLDDAYQAVHGVGLHSPNVDPVTGAVSPPSRRASRTLSAAQASLFRLLRAEGYSPAFQSVRYVICEEVAVHGGKTWLLLAVVARRGRDLDYNLASPPAEVYRVTPRADTVIDWVALDQSLLDDDKTFAYLFAAAVQAIKERHTAPDYAAMAQKWHDGDIPAVIAASNARAQVILDRMRAAPGPDKPRA